MSVAIVFATPVTQAQRIAQKGLEKLQAATSDKAAIQIGNDYLTRVGDVADLKEGTYTAVMQTAARAAQKDSNIRAAHTIALQTLAAGICSAPLGTVLHESCMQLAHTVIFDPDVNPEEYLAVTRPFGQAEKWVSEQPGAAHTIETAPVNAVGVDIHGIGFIASPR